MAKLYAGVLGVLAYWIVVMRGLLLGCSVDETMPLAIGVLVVFAMLGYLIGTIALSTVNESVTTTIKSEIREYEARQQQAHDVTT